LWFGAARRERVRKELISLISGKRSLAQVKSREGEGRAAILYLERVEIAAVEFGKMRLRTQSQDADEEHAKFNVVCKKSLSMSQSVGDS
jgi:hypothetical protein